MLSAGIQPGRPLLGRPGRAVCPTPPLQQEHMTRFQYEASQILDMQAEGAGRVVITVIRSDHLRPGDELELTPYGAWRIVVLISDPSPDVTTLLAVPLPG